MVFVDLRAFRQELRDVATEDESPRLDQYLGQPIAEGQSR